MIISLAFSSCQSQKEKELLIEEKKKQEQLLIEKQEKERLIIEVRRKKEAKEREKLNRQEEQKQKKLLSDSLDKETNSINESAKKLLEKKIETVIDSEAVMYDFTSDDSVTKFVNNKISFTNLEYIPIDLVKVDWEFIDSSKWNPQLRQWAFSALQKMSEDFFLQFKETMAIVSAYRSFKYQKRIKDGWCEDIFCAKAGFSEHQSGLAIDLWEASTESKFNENEKYREYFVWMKTYAHEYWFINTYQKWVRIDWYEVEPWHWRYVWKDFALFLKDNQSTFAEYYNNRDSF